MPKNGKARKRAARDILPSQGARLEAAGAAHVRVDRAAILITVSLHDGRAFDYYGVTDKWREHRGQDGWLDGFEHLLAVVQVSDKSSAAMADVKKVDVTIIADASFSSVGKSAGFGFWIKSGGLAGYSLGGAFTTPMQSACAAEISALANALAVGRQRNLVRQGQVVMLQSDSQHALGMILWKVAMSVDRPIKGGLATPKARRPQPHLRSLPGLELIDQIARELELKILVRHVKGHTKGDDGRSRINILCDKLAKDGMKTARSAFHAKRRQRAA